MSPIFSKLLVAMLSLWLPSTLQFSLRDSAGNVHRPDEWSRMKAVVVFFMTTDCPISNGYVPEMNRIRKLYQDRPVAFYAVQTDTTIPESEVRQHARDFAFSFPVLLDPQQILVRLANATVTPEVAVLSSSGEVLYIGRIDNRIEDFDKRRSVVTEFYLRDAIEAVLAGNPVSRSQTSPIGCGINFVKGEQER